MNTSESKTMSKTIFVFWKENNLDGEYELTIEKLKKSFKEWMQCKDPAWLKYYSSMLPMAFITDKEGLNSSADSGDYDELDHALNETKWTYLNELKIN